MSGWLSHFHAGRDGDVILTRRIRLRQPRVNDHGPWARLRDESRDFLRPWEPQWQPDELTMQAYRRRLRDYWRQARMGTALPLFLFTRDTHVLLGGLNLSNIRRGISQSASLGYWIGRRHARQGYMSEAVRAVTHHAFTRLKLHRIEAACIPENVASRRLLESCGFVREGLARRYLRIDGHWRDHVLFALLREDVDIPRQI